MTEREDDLASALAIALYWLHELEWLQDSEGLRYCESCRYSPRDGHHESCALAAAIAHVEAKLKP